MNSRKGARRHRQTAAPRVKWSGILFLERSLLDWGSLAALNCNLFELKRYFSTITDRLITAEQKLKPCLHEVFLRSLSHYTQRVWLDLFSDQEQYLFSP